MSASGRFEREITIEQPEYLESEGIVRPIWSFSSDGTYDEKIDTIHNGNVIHTTYTNGTGDSYPFDPIEIPISEVSQGDPYTVRVTPGEGISEDFFEPRTAIDEAKILEATETFSLPRTMRTDYSPSSSVETTFTYTVEGEFFNQTDWIIDLKNVEYDYDTETATMSMDAYWETDGGYVEGFIWLTLSVDGTVLRSYEESAGGSQETVEWNNYSGTGDTTWTFDAQPGDPIVVHMWERSSDSAKAIIDSDIDTPGEYEGRIVTHVPPDTRQPDVDLIDCSYAEDTVTVGREAQQTITLRNNTTIETEVELTYSGAGINRTVSVTVSPSATEDFEVSLTPMLTGEYDMTPGLHAERADR